MCPCPIGQGLKCPVTTRTLCSMLRRLAPAALLLAIACSDDPGFAPASARYSPEVLDFGVVSVAGERTLTFEVTNSGQVAYRIVDAAVPEDPRGLFRVEVPDSLRDGLAPGATAELAVTYRACPEAWQGDAPDPGFALEQCPTEVAAADLVITDESEGRRLPLTGAPGLPPRAELYCPRAIDADGCPMSLDETVRCTSLRFGSIGLGKTCEATIEVVNRRRAGAQTADLLVQDALLRVRTIEDPQMYDGLDAGFELLDVDGQPVDPSAEAPLVVAIPTGADEGRLRLRVRYTSRLGGVLAGDLGQGAGLRLATNSPEGELAASLYAVGLIPSIRFSLENDRAGPAQLQPEVGETARASFTLFNEGPGHATIAGVRLDPAAPELSIVPELAGEPLREGERRSFELVYARTEAELVRGWIHPEMVAPVEDPIPMQLNPEQTTDACEVTPGVLDFGATAGGELTASVRVRALATGTGCTISQLDVSAPNPTSASEFTVDLPGCSNLPCDPGITLCSPNTPGCTTSETQIPLRYRNRDVSTSDLAELYVTTSQRDDPTRIVVLQAMDDPCVPPTPVITAPGDDVCVGEPLTVDAAASLPGGRANPPGQIVSWEWALSFGTGSEFIPPDAETTTFTPLAVGPIFVTLSVTNDCGERSASPDTLMLLAGDCP